jgi:hypothetical protein
VCVCVCVCVCVVVVVGASSEWQFAASHSGIMLHQL